MLLPFFIVSLLRSCSTWQPCVVLLVWFYAPRYVIFHITARGSVSREICFLLFMRKKLTNFRRETSTLIAENLFSAVKKRRRGATLQKMKHDHDVLGVMKINDAVQRELLKPKPPTEKGKLCCRFRPALSTPVTLLHNAFRKHYSIKELSSLCWNQITIKTCNGWMSL